MADAYRRWAKAGGLATRECYLDDGSSGWPGRPLTQWPSSPVELRRLAPLLHVPQYLAARRQLAPLWRDVDQVHVAGAVAVHGSMAPRQVPVVAWFATTIADERNAIMPTLDSKRRWLYRTTLPGLQRLEREVFRRARRLMPMSHHTADLLVANGVDAKRIEVVPVPVDVTRFTPGTQDRRGVLFVGRFKDNRKGFSRVVDLLVRSAVARNEGLDVVSPGEKPRNLPPVIGSHVRWLGHVDDVAPAYRAAKLLVLPSLQEGLGIVAYEALACATPVVAWRCGGPDRYLAESDGGLVVDNADEFVTSVEALLTDEARRQEMGESGRRWVQAHMSEEQFLGNRDLFTP